MLCENYSGNDIDNKFLDGLDTNVGVGRSVNMQADKDKEYVLPRAIYHNKDFLLFDEPTSSLDKDTASIILSNLKKLSHNKAILIVSHDLKLLKDYCDEIYELKNNSLKRAG